MLIYLYQQIKDTNKMNKRTVKSELTGENAFDQAIKTMVTGPEYELFIESYYARRRELSLQTPFSQSDYIREIVYNHLNLKVFLPGPAPQKVAAELS